MLVYEFRRLINDRKNVYFFALILGALLYFVNSGIREYLQFQADRTQVLAYEKAQVKNFPTYKHYSGFGFRVLFEPSPLSIFFNNSTVLFDIEGKIDNTEVLKIYNLFKGKKLFYNRGYFKDFSGFIFFTGSLLMIYMGIIGFRSMDRLKFELQFLSLKKLFILSTAVRLFYLNLFFALAMMFSFGFALLQGLSFSMVEIHHYIAFMVYTLILLNFFYFLGLLLVILLKFRKTSYIWMFILWLFFIFLAPDLNRLFLFEDTKNLPTTASVEAEKVKQLLDFESNVLKGYEVAKKDKEKLRTFYTTYINQFLENFHLANKNKEEFLSRILEQSIRTYETRSLLFPTLYYFFLSAETSSKGYFGYLDFKDHMIATHEQFLRFYFTKYFIEKSKKVENFVKHNENLFKARSYLPGTFLWACLLSLQYCLLMGIAGFMLLKRLVYPHD